VALDGTDQAVTSIVSNTLTVGELSLHLHSGANWFYDLFRSSVESDMRSKLQASLISSTSKDTVDGVTNKLIIDLGSYFSHFR
jgi:hypothetical protein